MSETLFGTIESDAVISACELYRYWLIRRWGAGKALVFVMLNPSKADASRNDPTICRCIAFAKREGYDAVVVVNLYAWRATDPMALRVAVDPVGPDNDMWLSHTLRIAERDCAQVVAAWGANADPKRAAEVLAMGRFHALGVTKSGAPRHPLYVRGDAPLIEYGASA